jgi:hypothetical protein
MLLLASAVCHAQKVARDAEIYIYTKSGNMTVQMGEYKDESVITAFMFDDYGAFLRVDEAGGKTWIADVAAKKAYMLNQTNKTYSVIPLVVACFKARHFLGAINIESPTLKYHPSYKKLPDRVIAGKTCTTISLTDLSNKNPSAYIYSAWKGIFFRAGMANGETVFTATAFNDMVPKNSFTVPEDYTLVEFK